MKQRQTIRKLLLEYLTETTKRVKKIAAQGKGREILGEVINRPEDMEIAIDQVGEQILEKLLKKHKLAAVVFSEPEKREIKNDKGREPEFYGSIDPFDGSMLYLRGFEHNWYTVLSFFDKMRGPVCTGVADILNEKFYLSDEEGNFVMDIKGGEKKQIFPSRRGNLREPIVLASYLMSSQYSSKFLNIFGDLIKNMHSKALLYPQGGSFIYAFLAAGLVDAYVMFDEPRSEIDPGFSIAKRAGCEIVSVDSDGTYNDYEFLPGKQHDKVSLLVAAATPRLRDAIIEYYVKKYVRKYSFRT